MLSSFDIITPLKTEFFSQIFAVIRSRKQQFLERYELDHYMDGELDTNEPNADGYHKHLTMSEYSETNYIGTTVYEPEGFDDAGIVFVSNDAGTIKLNYKDSEGNVVEL